MKNIRTTLIVCLCFVFSLNAFASDKVKVGADKLDVLLPLLENKKVALVVNQTSCLSNGVHLLDTLISEGVTVTKIFAPEHGFRGNADAGETVKDGKDVKTGLPIVSLYGSNKKPGKSLIDDTDVIIFDIQDVGARFYTYISTMHYIMESCAENGKECIVLDRPNPCDYVDGPMLEQKYKSFVGMHPIPLLHGLTVGELAKMINGEKWLSNGGECNLSVVTADNWKHGQPYSLPIKPSPNLPNDQSIKLYPSLCFFEGTDISVGRGTYFPFQVIGYPDPKFGDFTFMPKSLEGFDKKPVQQDKLCYGLDLRNVEVTKGLDLEYLISFYKKSGLGTSFFKSPNHMDKLAGTNKLREQIIKGVSEKEIRDSWEADLDKYKTIRKKYLLYSDNK
ncbi:MAG: exo-beta-N-acetylmuramidase NamZ domain-containing protein [Dysgonomonas sp.]